MVELPVIRPEIAATSGWRGTVKRILTGARNINRAEIRAALPNNIAKHTLRPIDRTELISIPFVTDHHYVRVFTPGTTRIHRLLTWWRNFVAARNGYDTPIFASYDTHDALATYQHDALRDTFSNGGYVHEPITKVTTDNYSIIVTRRDSTKPQLDPEQLTSTQFNNTIRTLKTLHKHSYYHTDIPANFYQKDPSGRILITNPLGDAANGRAPAVEAYDLIGAMVKFTPTMGAWAVAHHVYDAYPDDTFEWIGAMSSILTHSHTRINNWTITQTADAVGEVLYEETGQTFDDLDITTPTLSRPNDTNDNPQQPPS